LLLSRFAFVDIWFLVAFQMYFVKLGCDCLCFLSCSVFFFVTGIYIINLGKTWEKLLLAARVIVAIENPQDIIVQSARPYGQRAVLKFAQYTGAHPIAGRHTPGTFTNQLQTSFSEPRLLILTDPRTDHQVRLTIIYISCSWWLVLVLSDFLTLTMSVFFFYFAANQGSSLGKYPNHCFLWHWLTNAVCGYWYSSQ